MAKRSRVLVLLATVVAYGSVVSGGSADPLPDIQAVAVNIERTPPQPWPGYGIYLGNGLVITAAHVAGHALLTQPRVAVAGQPLPTSTLKEGSVEDQDLTVLRITDPVPSGLAGRHTPVCHDAPHPGESVTVATPEKLTTSSIVAPEMLPPDLRVKYAASIKDVYSTGNSGSGVFDSDQHCLLGIMVSKIESHVRLIVNGEHVTRTIGVAKHFVPAADIRAFLQGLPTP
jgi:hypothetical protein